MATYGASNNLLLSVYSASQVANGRAPAPLGEPINYRGGRYVLCLSKDSISSGACVAFKAAVDPSLFQITRHDHTSTTTAGLAFGFAMATVVTGEYCFVFIGGVPDSAVVPNFLTDGSVAAGKTFIPSATTDGTIIVGTLGTDDDLALGTAIDDDAGTVLAPGHYVLRNRMRL